VKRNGEKRVLLEERERGGGEEKGPRMLKVFCVQGKGTQGLKNVNGYQIRISKKHVLLFCFCLFCFDFSLFLPCFWSFSS
jgi:hypothetical protein